MELIDKQELLDWIQNCWDWATVDGITSTTVLKQTMTDISQLPTVEAIPKDQYEARLKADMVAMLTEIQLEIEELSTPPAYQDEDYFLIGTNKCSELIQQKIDKYKADREEQE